MDITEGPVRVIRGPHKNKVGWHVAGLYTLDRNWVPVKFGCYPHEKGRFIRINKEDLQEVKHLEIDGQIFTRGADTTIAQDDEVELFDKICTIHPFEKIEAKIAFIDKLLEMDVIDDATWRTELRKIAGIRSSTEAES
jgi:hypothetical protein